MPVKHTGNTEFHSKSNSLGSTRWQVSLPPLVPRAYALKAAHMPHLSSLWWLVGVVKVGSDYHLRIYPAGNDADLSLDAADLQAILAGGPTVDVVYPVGTSEDETVWRLERGVANFMHGLLDPLPGVAHVWQQIANAEGAYAS